MQYLKVAIVFLISLAIASATNITMQGRIIGGKPVDIQEFPYMVSLRFRDRHICGGSIINSDTILTAAHCTRKSQPSQLTVRSGSNSADMGGTIHQVYQIQEHYNYDSEGKSFDVAKLKITPPITYSINSQPIKLCSKRPDDNTLLVVSGWGRHKQSGMPSATERRHLRAVHVRVVNQDRCDRKYTRREISSVMICAAANGKDSCQGDSGGPLVDPRTGEQCGLVSWGIGCASPKYPGVYASVPDLLDFIQS